MGDSRNYLKINPAAEFIDTAAGILVRTDLETLRLDGEDARTVCRRLVPLLDGTRELAEICQQLPDYTADSVTALLEVMMTRGVIIAARDQPNERWSGQISFFRGWADDAKACQERLQAAEVLVVGLETWTCTSLIELAAAGLGAIHLADSSRVALEDLPYLRFANAGDVGSLRREAVARALALMAPWCRVTTSDRGLPEGKWTLTLAGAAPSDLQLLLATAHFGQQCGIRTLFGWVEELYATVGPFVVPGQTPCWNCYRIRSLANAQHLREQVALQEAILRSGTPLRSRTYLGPMLSHAGHLIALEALKILSGYTPSSVGGRVLRQNLVTLETTLHTIISLPWCEVCGGAGGPLLRGNTSISTAGERGSPSNIGMSQCEDPSELRALLPGWIDAHTGVIQHLNVGTSTAVDPALPITASAVLSQYPDSCIHGEREIGSGKGLTRAEAMAGAVGEAIERYSAARYHLADLLYRPAADMDEEVFDPQSLCLYTPEQYSRGDFPFSRYSAEQAIHWARGKWLDSGADVWIPALPTYLNFRCSASERYCQVTTSGLAAGKSLEDAQTRAVCELAERDAFMLTWLGRLPARPLLIDHDLPPELLAVLRELETHGADIKFYLLNAGLPVSTVMSVALGDGSQWPGATVALGAHWDPSTALRKAILEQGHVGPYLRRLMLGTQLAVPETAEAVQTLIDHALYYFPVRRQGEFEFLEGSFAPLRISDLDQKAEPSVSELAQGFLAAGIRVAAADVTSPDVALSPFRVARVLGTYVQQIHFGYHLARLNSPRLRALTNEPNCAPHPLA